MDLSTDLPPPSGTLLKGRVAIVTGAGSGLGRGMALCLARNGASVVLTARRAEKLHDTADAIAAEGGTALVHALDLRDAAAIAAAFDAAEAAFGPVDTLINNAGIADANYAVRLSIDEIDSVISTNFRAPFLTSTELARRLIPRKERGWVINLSSVGAFHYSSSSAAALYSATKSGVIRITEALALEWAAFGINVNAIAPGMFNSEMTDGFIERVGSKVLERFPRHRFGQAGNLDTTLLYLLDPRSGFVTGATIIVDDGQQAR